MILACQNISKSFGVEPVIRNVSFHVEDQEKVAIVGINGAGKIHAVENYCWGTAGG